MTGSLIQEICPSLAKIALEDDWELVREHRSASFDNALVELRGEDFLVQASRDRGDVSICLSPLSENKKWIQLRAILEFLGESISSEDISTLLHLFIINRRKIDALMTSGTEQLELFEKKRSKEFLDKIFPPIK